MLNTERKLSVISASNSKTVPVFVAVVLIDTSVLPRCAPYSSL